MQSVIAQNARHSAALNIINLNIDSIQKGIRNCKANRGQEMYAVTEDCTNKDAQSVQSNKMSNGQQHHSQANKLINYFYSSNNTVKDKNKSSTMTQRIHEIFGNIFNGIGCFKGTFSLQLKPDSKPYQVLTKAYVAYALQKPFKEELQHLQELNIIAPLGVDKMVEWCNSFVLVPKANSKVQLCLDPVQLNQALIRPIHRGPMLNDILLKLNTCSTCPSSM